VGAGTHDTRGWVAGPLHRLLHATLLRPPEKRAVFHFISQSLFRVQRYRIYLVLYGGAGLSVLVATVLRVVVIGQQVRVEISADGIRAAIGIVAFWLIAGLRMAFVSPGNQQGSWVFRIIHGRPPHIDPALQQLEAARLWAFLWGLIATIVTCLVLRAFAHAELRTWPAAASELLLSAGMCLLLSDALFLQVKTVAFTGAPQREQSNLAFTVLKYFTFFPIVIGLPVAFEPWIAAGPGHFLIAAAVIVAAHRAFIAQHQRTIREHCAMPALEDDEDDFPMKLGLRY